MMPMLCFPSVRGNDLTAELMNWTVVVYGGPMTFIIIWWFVSAHKWFKGPVINVEVCGLYAMGRSKANSSSIICLEGMKCLRVSSLRVMYQVSEITRRIWMVSLCQW